MALVREGYRPVYRPRRYAFVDTRETRAGLDQAMEIQDEGGTDWIALFSRAPGRRILEDRRVPACPGAGRTGLTESFMFSDPSSRTRRLRG